MPMDNMATRARDRMQAGGGLPPLGMGTSVRTGRLWMEWTFPDRSRLTVHVAGVMAGVGLPPFAEEG